MHRTAFDQTRILKNLIQEIQPRGTRAELGTFHRWRFSRCLRHFQLECLASRRFDGVQITGGFIQSRTLGGGKELLLAGRMETKSQSKQVRDAVARLFREEGYGSWLDADHVSTASLTIRLRDPESARRGKAFTLFDGRRYAEALPIFLTAVLEEPDRQDNRYLAAACAIRTGDRALAAAVLLPAVRQDLRYGLDIGMKLERFQLPGRPVLEGLLTRLRAQVTAEQGEARRSVAQ